MIASISFGAPAVFDGDVLSLDIAGIRQSPVKIGQISARLVPRCQVKKSDHRQRRLLRARREWPRSRRAAERRQEFSSFDLACHVTLRLGGHSCNAAMIPRFHRAVCD